MAALAFFFALPSSLRIALASLAAVFSILDFSLASLLPRGSSESSDSPIAVSDAFGGFFDEADAFPLTLLDGGASSESESSKVLVFVKDLRGRLLWAQSVLNSRRGLLDDMHTKGSSSSSSEPEPASV